MKMDVKKISKYIIAVCALIATIVGALEVFKTDVEEIKVVEVDTVKVELPKLDSVIVDSLIIDTNEVK